jgi:hypothetical protein
MQQRRQYARKPTSPADMTASPIIGQPERSDQNARDSCRSLHIVDSLKRFERAGMEGLMAEMIVVDERNQDDLSRKAGCFLYSDTQLWLESGLVHRTDGPAVVFPDGAERWYLRGKEVTRDVKSYFFENKWSVTLGLDTQEKRRKFVSRFLS